MTPTPEEQAALERQRELYETTSDFDGYIDTVQRWHDEELVIQLALREHPANETKPITKEWLLELDPAGGGELVNLDSYRWLTFARVNGKYVVTYHFPNIYVCAMLCSVENRGAARRLVAALREEQGE